MTVMYVPSEHRRLFEFIKKHYKDKITFLNDGFSLSLSTTEEICEICQIDRMTLGFIVNFIYGQHRGNEIRYGSPNDSIPLRQTSN